MKTTLVLLTSALVIFAHAEDLAPKCDVGCGRCSDDNTRCIGCAGTNSGILDGKCVPSTNGCAATYYDSDSKTDKCNSCKDPKKQYVKEGTSCADVPTPIENCDDHRTDTTCRRCAVGFLLSDDSKKCDKITTVNNCYDYSSTTQCSSCTGKYYVEGNACVASTIDGCVSTYTKATCSVCDSGKKLNKDRTLCEAGPATPIDNCDNYAVDSTDAVICNGCKEGYETSNDLKTCTAMKPVPKGCANPDCDYCDVSANFYSDYTNTTANPKTQVCVGFSMIQNAISAVLLLGLVGLRA